MKRDLITEVLKPLDLLEQASIKFCKEYQTKAVPIEVISEYVKVIKRNYKKGFNRKGGAGK